MTQQVKSPFLVIPEFVSPLMCEEIVDALDFTVPDTDKKGVPISSYRSNEEYEEYLYEEFLKYKHDIEVHFNVAHQATCQTTFEIYPEGSRGKLICDNSAYIREKWVRVKDRDLTCLVFLSEYNDNPDFDDGYEVYGGKVEFPQHGFGFNPQRGTMVVFPSVPQFINTVTPIHAGDLFTARFHIKTAVPFLYDPQQFPGNYKTWFSEIV